MDTASDSSTTNNDFPLRKTGKGFFYDSFNIYRKFFCCL